MSTLDGSGKLRDAVSVLKQLLAQTPPILEVQFQDWFEMHPVVFEALGFRRSIPRPRFPLDAERFLEPDFLVEDFNGVWSVFELKRHDLEVLKNPDRRTDLRSEFSTYVQQCREYAMYFADANNRHQVEQLYGIRVQREVPSIIIASTDTLTDHSIARDLLVDRGNRVELRTYSEIMRTLLRQLDWTSTDTARKPGICIGVLGVFPENGQEQVIFDIGQLRDQSRVSIGLQGTNIVLSLVDIDGFQRRWEIPRPLIVEFENSTPLELIEVELGVSPTSLFVAVHHNRRCIMQQQLPPMSVSARDLAGGMAIGTDVTGRIAADFEMVEAFAYTRTLAPSERLQIYEHLDEVYRYYLSPLAIHRPPRVSFRGSKGLTTAGHPLSNEAAKDPSDPSGPWGWWTSTDVIVGDGIRVPPDSRLGSCKILLPGMKPPA